MVTWDTAEDSELDDIEESFPTGFHGYHISPLFSYFIKCFVFYRLLLYRSDVYRTLESIFTANPLFEPMGSLEYYGPLFLSEALNFTVEMLSL